LDDDDDPSLFEAELAMLEEVEADQRNEALEMGDGPEAQTTSVRWSRPSVPPFDPLRDALVFQQLDVDSYTGKSVFPELPQSSHSQFGTL